MEEVKNDVSPPAAEAEAEMDDEIRQTVLTDIAQLIKTRPERVKSILRKADFPVPEEVTDEDLVKLVSDAIYKSKKFATLLVKNIAKVKSYYEGGDYGEEGENELTFYNQSGFGPPEYQPAPTGSKFDWSKALDTGVGLLGKFFGPKPDPTPTGGGGYAPSQPSPATQQNSMMDMMMMMMMMKKGEGGKGYQPNVGLMVGVGAGVLVLVMIIVIATKK